VPDAVVRFADIAGEYDAVRPHPPTEIAEVLRQWSGTEKPDVVDVGAGTGLSAAIWAGRARSVVAVEPGDGMRAVAMRRLGLAPESAPAPTPGADSPGADSPGTGCFGAEFPRAGFPRADSPDAESRPGFRAAGTRFSVVAGSAEETGLADSCADIVTASQAMHWFDAARALPEIARILRPGGVFAAYDCDWPPCIDWETDAAYTAFDTRVAELETARGLRPPHAGKGGHLNRIENSGLFRYAAEIALGSKEQGDARRLAAVALSQGSAVALLKAGASADEIGLTALWEIAGRRLPGPRTWWWTYRVRLAVK
jgi:SAM-dependent methyltransferase